MIGITFAPSLLRNTPVSSRENFFESSKPLCIFQLPAIISSRTFTSEYFYSYVYQFEKGEDTSRFFPHAKPDTPENSGVANATPPPLDASSVKADEKNKGSQRKADTA
jgi:hypothetical protein